ncbi:unnamed protein product [Clonostachys rosea f. rosea IK726]|uniref:Uncharacterized protein n=2 Tax=Bionectria ochroleuca TaxID=29856 RepID=A0A0B7KS55_BIOOC|nr:unnamed protein product [Clonostachys rosea f. rosea IK726]
MDGLRTLAASEFEAVSGGDTRFDDSIHHFGFIQVQLKDEQVTINLAGDISKNELDLKMAARASSVGGGSSSPELNLVRIRIKDPFPFYIEKGLFLQIFETLQLDPYILHLILQNSYGFHQFPATQPLTNGQVVFSYFLSTIMYMLAWSFNPVTMETRAILMTRIANGITTCHEIERYFNRILSVHANHVYAPTFLSLTAGTQLVHFLDEYILDRLQVIREVEAHTGHGDIMAIRDKISANEITKFSRDTGRVLAVLANIRRHLLISKAVIEHVSKMLDSKRLTKLSVSSRNLHDKHKELLMDVVSMLDTQVTWNESYVAYLLERAKVQIAVLQSLLANEGVSQSMSLANKSIKLTSVSALIAQRAAEDSSAMKTIAIMTMLFLPGTFFAALFALPLLKWDESNVIQKKFWMYWAFTLPATVLVFIVWKVLTGNGREMVQSHHLHRGPASSIRRFSLLSPRA